MNGQTAYDFNLYDGDSVLVLRPLNDAARSWIDENIYAGEADGTDSPHWFGDGIAIEARYVDGIAGGIVEDGLTLSVSL